MTALRDALLARLAELREAEQAATPGPWDVGHERIVYTQHGGGLRQVATVPGSVDVAGVIADARLIALSRNTLAPFAEGLAAEVECGHERIPMQASLGSAHRRAGCATCQVYLGVYDDCPFVLRWADRLGVTA